ncbi:hypothetical protein [Empedobacter falsenii]|uniref:Uncharacterized protein n=1 Tax=Empedobacter falsenii TaxID=343874 RepID=A0AAW7DH76_9FLAO|nr:hypothetical protein [Empedobacter falsenii]MDM1551200.1 hypothetical protein [Empedobacter falsenii]
MKKIYSLCFLIITNIIYSQVGIGTQYPLSSLHIDGKSDNTSTSTIPENDIVVTNTAYMGIGIINPSTPLHINNNKIASSFKLVDGTEGLGRILTSLNDNGEIAWNFKPFTKTVDYDGVNLYQGLVNSDMKYIGRKITLEHGKWLIKTNLLLATDNSADVNNGFYAKFSWAELDSNNTYKITPDGIFGNTIGGVYNKRFGLTNGSTIIHNKTAQSKTYYLLTLKPIFFGNYDQNAKWWDLGGDFWRETAIIAFPAN